MTSSGDDGSVSGSGAIVTAAGRGTTGSIGVGGCEMMKKVLIIEDYYALADIESLLCTMEGYEVKVAKSGDEGLKLFEEFQPDLVLLDLMLPGEMSGSQVLERIRADHGHQPKVLVVSALVNPTTAPKLEAYGNVETLGKPFKIKELAARIQAMLDA
jgi:DNA-binding response OmpR family regulator